jgi:hypothetical protein
LDAGSSLANKGRLRRSFYQTLRPATVLRAFRSGPSQPQAGPTPLGRWGSQISQDPKKPRQFRNAAELPIVTYAPQNGPVPPSDS